MRQKRIEETPSAKQEGSSSRCCPKREVSYAQAESRDKHTIDVNA